MHPDVRGWQHGVSIVWKDMAITMAALGIFPDLTAQKARFEPLSACQILIRAFRTTHVKGADLVPEELFSFT